MSSGKLTQQLLRAQQWLAHVLLALPRPAKRAMAIVVDALLCLLATSVALYLRIGEWVALTGNLWIAVAASIMLALPLFVVSGLYRAIFRHSGSAALIAVAQASLVYGVLYATLITIIQIPSVPRTVGLIQPVLVFIFIASSRVVVGWFLGPAYLSMLGDRTNHSVMIYGAGFAGRQLLKGLSTSDLRVVGFIDDDPALQGRVLLGRPVFGPDDIAGLIDRFALTDILLAIPSVSRRRRHEIIEAIAPLPVSVRTVPGLDDVAKGRIKTTDLRELEIEDLLGRDAVAPNRELLSSRITGKTVLVTGAGGSIGSELCRQILAQGPATLLLVEMSEPALYAIERELAPQAAKSPVPPMVIPLLASVCNRDRLDEIIAAWRPDTIYHAAAYKHVPLVEHNPAEGIANNVFGTLTLAQAALAGGVANLVFISTDKAVRPTNIMGASKRLAEQVLQALAQGSSTTRLSMVRFGNVLGSSGSVVPLFRQQIQSGGPITVTHPDITRYFMTIPEAAQLVIQAGAMARGGEVFVLDMGEPVRIVELARMMVQLSGLALRDADNPDGEIELAFVGLRPGEKLYEELLIGNNPVETDHPRIMKANEVFLPWAQLERELAALAAALRDGDVALIGELVGRLVPEYAPEGVGAMADWNHRRRMQSRIGKPG